MSSFSLRLKVQIRSLTLINPFNNTAQPSLARLQSDAESIKVDMQECYPDRVHSLVGELPRTNQTDQKMA